jgi:secreted trypsin-like serine protease
MIFRSSKRATDSAAAVGLSKILLILSIVAITGTGLFIIALAIGFGVGFGVSNRSSNNAPATLAPPIVSCSGSTSSLSCGCPTYSPSFTPRIIDGTPAATNSWPWLVYITINNIRVCTGFLISPRFVLTAGSCVGQSNGYNITVNLGINNFQSIYGGVNVTNATVLTAIAIGDIALVQLGTNITYSSTIKPCCLTSLQSIPTNGTNGVIAGWGETSTSSIGIVSPLLEQAVVQVRDQSTCGTQTANDTLCASFGGVSTCPIDAGGPLMISNNNAWTCVGIIISRTGGCNNPITFTRIASYTSVIQNITGLIY